MRFTIGSEMYDLQGLDRLTLGEILKLEAETAALGRPMKWSQIRTMAQELEGLKGDEFEDHDDSPWVVALVVWASRLRKGDTLSFADAIDFPLSDLTFLPDTEDHQVARGPQKPRPASGRGAKAQRVKAAKKTSAAPSSPA